MARKPISFLKIAAILFSKVSLIDSRNIQSLRSKNVDDTTKKPSKFFEYSSLDTTGRTRDLSDKTLVFQFEGALLKSSSLYPYFMLVAFEAGGILRALVLLLLYPLICMVGEATGLKIMVFLCFFGIKMDKFRIGKSVLPKYFLEDVGREGFEIIVENVSWAKRIAVSDMPSVMAEGFLRDYMGIEKVIGRELRVVNGYFVGLLDDGNKGEVAMEEVMEASGSGAIGFGPLSSLLHRAPFTYCEEVYWVPNGEKKNWENLPRESHPKPLIFHDGRLAFKPTPEATLALFMYIPLGTLLFFVRLIFGRILSSPIFVPVLAFSGMRLRTTISESSKKDREEYSKRRPKKTGKVYVCNHKTILDPVYLKAILGGNCNLAAATYGISKLNKLISPLKTISLKRDREEDKKQISEVLSEWDLIIFPEGTTCREPYLLRFSPLFAEMSEEIVPVAIDMEVGTFYGSTASGLKIFDPAFHLLNPCPIYRVKFLEELPRRCTCKDGGRSNIEVANYVQGEIAKALGFRCTNLTRRDKYEVLAGNSGEIKVGG